MDVLSYWQSQLTNTDCQQYPTSSLRKKLLSFASAKLSPDLVLVSLPSCYSFVQFHPEQSLLCQAHWYPAYWEDHEFKAGPDNKWWRNTVISSHLSIKMEKTEPQEKHWSVDVALGRKGMKDMDRKLDQCCILELGQMGGKEESRDWRKFWNEKIYKADVSAKQSCYQWI